MENFRLFVMLAAVILLLLQCCAGLMLLWRVVLRWRPDALALQRAGRWLLVSGAIFAPLYMLVLSTLMHGAYQGERGGHWFFHSHSGLAGLVLVPVYAAGSLSLAVSLIRGVQHRSGTNLVVLLTLLAISVWYSYATFFLRMGDDKDFDMSVTAIVPALAALNYALIALAIMRNARLESPRLLAVSVWLGALTVSLLAKIPLAKNLYAALPPQPPAGYGDCFVVGAAARGHASFVGSQFDLQRGQPVNDQLRTLQAFERCLVARQPVLHRHIRRVYNRVGPPIAAQIRSPFIADMIYVLLKPIEWLARAYLAADV